MTHYTSGTITIPSNSTNNAVRIETASASNAAVAWVFNQSVDGRNSLDGTGTYAFGSMTGNGYVTTNTSTTVISAGALGLNDLFSGVMDGVGAFTKVGTGTMTLTGANTYSGATTVTAGTLQIGGGTSGSIATGSVVSTGASGTLAFDLANTGTFTNAIANSGTVAGVETTGITNTLAGNITGGGGVSQTGAGTTILKGTDSYSGATSVTAGTLQIGNGAAGTISSSSAVSTGASGTLALDLANTGTFTNAIANSGTVAGVETMGITNTLSGNITGGGGVAQTGAGTTILLGADSYSGATSVTAGTLQFGNGTNGSVTGTSSITLAAGTLVFDEVNGTTTSASISTSGSVVGGEGSGITNTLSGAISGTGGFTQSGSGTTTLTNGESYAGTTTISAGTLALGSGGSLTSTAAVVANGTLDISSGSDQTIGSLTGSGIVALGGHNLALSTQSTDTYSGVFNDGGIGGGSGGSLTVNNGGTLVLNGTSAGTFSGPTTVSNGSIIQYASSASFAQTSPIVVGDTTSAIQLTGGITGGSAAISLQGYGVNSADALENVSGTNTVNSNITLTGDTGIRSDAGSTLIVTGTISNNAGGAELELDGASTNANTISGVVSDGNGPTDISAFNSNWVLTGANTYTGGTYVTGGTLQVGNGGTTGNLGSGVVSNGGTLAYDRSDSALVESNVISGTGSVNQIGSGATTFTATNTYSGGTTVTLGKLYVNGGTAGTSSSGTGSGAVTVNNGGTLAGSGNISTSAGVTINNGGSLASGGMQTGAPNVTGTGITFTDTSVTLNGDAPANLTFDLGAGNTAGSGYHTFGTPNTNTTYMTLSGSSTLNFLGTDSVSLVDLTGGSLLQLRQGTPYLLVMATSGLDTAYTGLVTSLDGKTDDLTMDGNGWVMGVGTITSYTPISILQFGADGVTPLTGSQIYPEPVLYLYNGDLEVVPEPGTWALMLGGLALLVVIQRRRKMD